MTDDRIDLMASIQHWSDGAWCLAALSLVLGRRSDEARASAREVLEAVGLDPDELEVALGDGSQGLAGQEMSSLLLPAAVVRDGDVWDALPDEVILAQGAGSASAAPLFRRAVLPLLDGLQERLARPGARMLDVGTGVGLLAAAFAREFPNLHVVGIDVSPRVLGLARRSASEEEVSSRLEFREGDVAALQETACYDLAWVPAPFLPEAAVRAGIPAVREALAAGGWVLVGHAKHNTDRLPRALDRLRTVVYGGTLLDDESAADCLLDAGFVRVQTVRTPPGAPSITVGQAPG